VTALDVGEEAANEMGARVFASCFFVSAVLAGAPIRAQTVDSPPPGSVSGHVSCADTNRPARLARVTIEPVDDFLAVRVDAGGNIVRQRSVSTAIVAQTGADGDYSIESVPPGPYYIVAELPGYLSPVTEFAVENMSLPNAHDEQRFRELLQKITVIGGRTARMDFRLERGGTIDGKVLYDDGSPVTGAWINVLRKDEKLGWQPLSDIALSRFQYALATDDRGHYRITMLAPGEYLVAVAIRQVTMSSSGETLPGLAAPRGSLFTTQIYVGGSARRGTAKPITLRKGEEYTGADITVAISKMHLLSGTIVSARDGHPIDRAAVSLVDSTDGTPVKEAAVFGNGRFAMQFVPEGEYLLKVTDAKDGAMQTSPSEGSTETYTRFVPQHVYADAEQSLIVSGDVSGLTIQVPEPTGSGP
jgi:Carboxypeptidase regulatory-like domain